MIAKALLTSKKQFEEKKIGERLHVKKNYECISYSATCLFQRTGGGFTELKQKLTESQHNANWKIYTQLN
jgi:hypothetical protein